MYNEPHRDEEQYRLKRKDDDATSFNATTFVGWIFIPAVIGMFVTLILTVAVPNIVTSMTRGASFNVMADNLIKVFNQEFSLLAAMKWGETNIWLYLLFGALAGIFIKYVYSGEKLR